MKNRITLIFAVLCYYCGIDSLLYYLNRKSKRIITFHNVMPENLLPEGKKIGLTETEETFAMKIREMEKHFTLSADVDNSRTLTITFDDGYRNEYEIAKKYAPNGIIFVSGKVMNNTEPSKTLTIDLLMHWMELVPEGKYIVDYATMVKRVLEVTSDNRQWLWQKVLWPSFVADAETMGHGLLVALDKVYPIKDVLAKCSPEYLRLRLTGFSQEELDNIKKDEWLFGWHTQEHFPLAALSSEQKEMEISLSAPEWMKKTVLSFPYGEMQSVDECCLQIAKLAGYPCAVSNLPYPNSMSGRFFLPRMTLSDNKYLLHLELSGAKYFIQSRKLLPQFV